MTTSTPVGPAAQETAQDKTMDMMDEPSRAMNNMTNNMTNQATEGGQSLKQDEGRWRADDARSTAAPTNVGMLGLSHEAVRFYTDAMRVLQRANIPFMVGGAYALHAYTGITRHTKDFDIFLLPCDVHAGLAAFEAAGYRTKMQADYWLAKVFDGESFVDLIFASGNGVARVDEVWLEQAREAEVFGMRVKLIPPEEMIWSKGFIMERERYDGADVEHVLLRLAGQLDWNRLIARFGENWRVLLSALVLFGFIYPGQRHRVPAWVMDKLLGRAQSEAHTSAPDERVCNGTMLSRQQYLVDVCEWGFKDGRLVHGYMTPEQIEEYTAAINKDGSPLEPERLHHLEHELHEKLERDVPAPTDSSSDSR
ncbi:MAG TPA: nucleotidyltransferase [Ktedonobacterales bacterium]